MNSQDKYFISLLKRSRNNDQPSTRGTQSVVFLKTILNKINQDFLEKWLIFFFNPYFFFFFFWLCPGACCILVPQPWVKPMPPALEAWDLKHWTTRKLEQAMYKKTLENLHILERKRTIKDY